MQILTARAYPVSISNNEPICLILDQCFLKKKVDCDFDGRKPDGCLIETMENSNHLALSFYFGPKSFPYKKSIP